MAEAFADLPRQLLWLKDAPLLIDDIKLAAFYDAVVRPPHNEGSRVIKITEGTTKEIEGKLGIKAGLSLPTWLSHFFDAKAEVSADGKVGGKTASTEDQTITLEPIKTPQRQLEQLTIFYLTTTAERLFLVSNLEEENWRNEDVIAKVPRALAFLDFPRGTQIIPTAAEFMDGKIVTFFDQMAADDGRKPPIYPSHREDDATYKAKSLEYWEWYQTNFRPQMAINLIEKASEESGKINWIDYRVPLSTRGETLHLHVCGHGNYDTGTYAYYTIRRAYEHGLRLVGTLKVEPDMNVLAMYEK